MSSFAERSFHLAPGANSIWATGALPVSVNTRSVPRARPRVLTEIAFAGRKLEVAISERHAVPAVRQVLPERVLPLPRLRVEVGRVLGKIRVIFAHAERVRDALALPSVGMAGDGGWVCARPASGPGSMPLEVSLAWAKRPSGVNSTFSAQAWRENVRRSVGRC